MGELWVSTKRVVMIRAGKRTSRYCDAMSSDSCSAEMSDTRASLDTFVSSSSSLRRLGPLCGGERGVGGALGSDEGIWSTAPGACVLAQAPDSCRRQ